MTVDTVQLGKFLFKQHFDDVVEANHAQIIKELDTLKSQYKTIVEVFKLARRVGCSPKAAANRMFPPVAGVSKVPGYLVEYLEEQQRNKGLFIPLDAIPDEREA